MSNYFSRPAIESEIKNFLCNPAKKSGFTYVRGRRRIGKSTLLEKITSQNRTHIFYFTGAQDESATSAMARFAKQWDIFSPNSQLSKIKESELSWDFIFEQINQQIKISRHPHIGLIFDEIQWLAKIGSGFLGLLKAAWLRFEANHKTRVIICGSSNKFFSLHVGGEEKTLRGLKTHSDIWVPSLTIAEIKKHYGHNYSVEEVMLGYMMLGGVPYYWNQINTQLNFMQAFNQALFTKSTVFIEEVDEVLKLEFNNKGLPTIKKILSQLAYPGKTATAIIKDSGLPESTTIEALEKLLEYNILGGDSPALNKAKINKSGLLYYCKDPYLNFYFSLYKKWITKISSNKNSFIISNVFDSTKSLFINGFTGPAFELVIRAHLENTHNIWTSLLKVLEIDNISWEVGRHWDKTHEIDIIIYNCEDRVNRIIECKWSKGKELVSQTKQQISVITEKYPTSKIFVLSNKKSNEPNWICINDLL
jgi:AAA+ ATPase superfamily predicted ATPase